MLAQAARGHLASWALREALPSEPMGAPLKKWLWRPYPPPTGAAPAPHGCAAACDSVRPSQLRAAGLHAARDALVTPATSLNE